MATELADLAIAGSKAPLRLVRGYGPGREPMPKPGDCVIVPDGEARPRSIWRTTEVTIEPLSQADEAFAWDEGRGDHTRAWCSMPTSSHSLIRSSPEPVVRYTRFRWTLWHFWFFTLLTDLD
jgi:uncharacterized protein YhfF